MNRGRDRDQKSRVVSQMEDKLSEQFKEQIGPMTSLAERFAAEGQMSLSKSTEAAAYVLIRRAGWQ